MKYTVNKPTTQIYSLIVLTIRVLVCVSMVSSSHSNYINLRPSPGYENQTLVRVRGVREPVTLHITYSVPTDADYIQLTYTKSKNNRVYKKIWTTMAVWYGDKDPVNKGMSGYSASPHPSHRSHALSVKKPDPSYSGMYGVFLVYEKERTNYSDAIEPKMYLDIQTPPQFTLMINYIESNVVNEGNAASLRCTTPEFYPLKVNASIFIAGVKNGCEPSTSWTSDWPRSLCERSETFAREENQEVTIQCRAEWHGQPPIRGPLVVLNVTFPPTTVTMTKALPSSPVDAQTKVSVICETNTANPTATIVWRKYPELIGEDSETFTITASERDGGHHADISISQLSFIATHELSGQVFSCSVLGFNSIPAQTSELVVIKVPPDPKLSIYHDSTPVISVIKEGQSARVDCLSPPTSPFPTSLSIKKGGDNVSCASSIDVNGTHKCTADVTFHRQENMVEWECNVLWNGLIFKSNTKIYVIFSSKTLSMIESFSSELVPQGNRVSITCETGSANTGQSITWVTDGTRVTAGNSYDITARQTAGQFNGVITTNSLNFTVTKQHGGSIFECSIEDNNSVQPQTSTLNVAFPASWVKMTQKFPAVAVAVGSRLNIICETETANPIATITWAINGAQLVESENYTVTSFEREGEYNGKIAFSTLSFSVTLDEHGKKYECSILGNNAVTPQQSTLKVQGAADQSEVQGKQGSQTNKLTAVHIALICVSSIMFVTLVLAVVVYMYRRPSKVAEENPDMDYLENIPSTGDVTIQNTR